MRSLWRPAFHTDIWTAPIGVRLPLRVCRAHCCPPACRRPHCCLGCSSSAARSRLRVVVCMCARNIPRFMRLFRHRARLRRAVRLVRCMERVFGCIRTRRPSPCNVVTQSTQCVPRVPQGVARVPPMRQLARPAHICAGTGWAHPAPICGCERACSSGLLSSAACRGSRGL